MWKKFNCLNIWNESYRLTAGSCNVCDIKYVHESIANIVNLWTKFAANSSKPSFKMFVNHNINFQSFDVSKVSTKDLEFTSPFSLTAKKDCCVTALVGYFDTYFNSLENKVSLKYFFV